jgi:hypothetical protein
MSERKPCHNCRRRRLRCDLSVPTCYKCTKTGQKCLGYGQLYRWVDSETAGVQARQRNSSALAPNTGYHGLSLTQGVKRRSEPYNASAFGKVEDEIPQPFVMSLADPLLQDLDGSSRRYMSYCMFIHSYLLWQRSRTDFTDSYVSLLPRSCHPRLS